ncbi:MAG: hypothetical protein PVS3B3_13850 [Ktedonobacteraceae bacterium]
MSIKRELADLSRDLERPRPKGYEPFDKSAYCAFMHAANRLRNDALDLAGEAERLSALALHKYQALAQEK